MPMAQRRVRIRQAEIVGRFADRLRAVRLSRGMTQADLAHRANVTDSYVSRLEAGRAAPGIDLVERLAKALGTDAADLLSGPGQPDPLPVLKEQAQRMLNTLIERGDREAFLKLNPVLALLVEASTKRG